MKTSHRFIVVVLLGVLLLASCRPRPRVGELRSESQSVELEGDGPVRVEVNFGAGDIGLKGGADELLEADFTYNVALLKPEVEYTEGTLVIQQPEAGGMPVLQDLTDFRNEWDLRLYDAVPMDLRVNVGGGTSNLRLAGLSLTGLDVSLGAGTSTVDLNGEWARDLDVTIDAGATDLTVRLPGDVGVRVEVDRGPTMIDAVDFVQDGNIYTNEAYGRAGVNLHIAISTGIGWLTLELVNDR